MIVHKNNISQAANDILQQYTHYRIFILDGEMGVGKTTLSTAFAKALGSLDHPSSPTFSIVNVYLRDNSEELFHFDFYRLEHIEEAIDIGIEEYFESGNYCFIEWPDIIERLLPKSYVRIKMQHTDKPDERYFEISVNN